MSKLRPTHTLIFDLDGTLFETDALLRIVHERTFDQLRAEGSYTLAPPSFERMLSCVGMIVDDFWEKMIPDATAAAKQRADELFAANELALLAAGEGQLYPRVAEVLSTLKERGAQLFVASNGAEPYVRAVCAHMGIAPLFTGIYSAGQYGTSSKVDLVRHLLDEHGIDYAWMVGDRSSDMIAGHRNALGTVGCAYADFGHASEIAEADVLIGHFHELLDL